MTAPVRNITIVGQRVPHHLIFRQPMSNVHVLPNNCAQQSQEIFSMEQWIFGGARGVMVIVVGNGQGDTSSNPGRDWLQSIILPPDIGK